MSKLNMAEIGRRTAVERPYFAFDELSLSADGAVVGDVRREHALGYECGPLGAAEIGRHLAILGSCAAAAHSASDERLYYLVTHAELRRHGVVRAGLPLARDACRGTATIVERTARTLSAQTTMQIGDDAPFVSLFVRYRVLSELLFARLFAHLAVGRDHTGIASPYVEPIPLVWSEPRGDSIVARNHGLSARDCAGHFRGYPAWPVAIIASCMLRTVERLLHHALRFPVQWVMDSCELDALELIPAAASVVFSTTYRGAAAGETRHAFVCEAHVDDKLCARMSTVVSTQEAIHSIDVIETAGGLTVL
ncbi:hypothetical protein [Paraburkholderia sp. 2C]|jgi:hypothetical protein